MKEIERIRKLLNYEISFIMELREAILENTEQNLRWLKKQETRIHDLGKTMDALLKEREA